MPASAQLQTVFQNIAPVILLPIRVNWLVNDTIISKVFKERVTDEGSPIRSDKTSKDVTIGLRVTICINKDFFRRRKPDTVGVREEEKNIVTCRLILDYQFFVGAMWQKKVYELHVNLKGFDKTDPRSSKALLLLTEV